MSVIYDEKAPWCKVQGGVDKVLFICGRCKSTYAADLPVPVDIFVEMTRSFVALHRFCREGAHE